MYIPNLPAKYGTKIEMMWDTRIYYMIDAIPYLGNTTNTGGLSSGEFLVKELKRTIYGANMNATTDNWFTCVPFSKSLQLKPDKLTIVGTSFSIFCYDDPLTLLSFTPKTKGNLLVVVP